MACCEGQTCSSCRNTAPCFLASHQVTDTASEFYLFPVSDVTMNTGASFSQKTAWAEFGLF